MAAPVQPMGTTSVIPPERPKLGNSLREHLENYSQVTSLAGHNLRWDSFDVQMEAARYFAYRYEGNPDPDFQHPRLAEMIRKLKEALEAVLGYNVVGITFRSPNWANLGQDIIDNADEIEAEFYRRFGDPGDETGLDGGGPSLEHTPMGKQVQGRGHKLFR
jgi:peptidoglycan/xylan/chitin deacetylase (PgdA/CDA1 family)